MKKTMFLLFLSLSYARPAFCQSISDRLDELEKGTARIKALEIKVDRIESKVDAIGSKVDSLTQTSTQALPLATPKPSTTSTTAPSCQQCYSYDGGITWTMQAPVYSGSCANGSCSTSEGTVGNYLYSESTGSCANGSCSRGFVRGLGLFRRR